MTFPRLAATALVAAGLLTCAQDEKRRSREDRVDADVDLLDRGEVAEVDAGNDGRRVANIEVL
ncbi:hypothetical protein ADK55_14410 [Streptomyces sp. WM4235]|nr:hypothetical protein ADK55_14410 [Streptomyces sp. WM4235]